MASPTKALSKAARKEHRPRSPTDKKQGKLLEKSFSSENEEQSSSSTLQGDDLQALVIKPEHLNMIRAPQPPKEPPKPRPKTQVLIRKTRPPEEVRKGVVVSVARPLHMDTTPEPLDYSGPGGPRFDAQGMVLPHSILGSLENFRRAMEVRGETELVKRIPDQKIQRPLEVDAQKRNEKTKVHEQEGLDHQGHALQNWHHHMTERRRQQNFIAHLLEKPVEELLMNQSNRFRKIKEQREILSRGLPALYPGHGSRVGSEFWSVPEHFGDELSGITATLTQTEKGNPPPITHIAQPTGARQESGNTMSDGPVSRAWSQSQYLHHRQHELRDILRELDFNQPDMDELEVVGSSQPYTSPLVQHSPLLKEEEQSEEEEEEEGINQEYKENEDPLEFYEDVVLDVQLIPALRLCGELACWTGSTTSQQDEVGMAVRVLFETVVGESVCSHLELKNEGSTAIYYSWHKLAVPHSFTNIRPQRHTQHFYFNTAKASILPGDIKRIQVTFKSTYPGIMSEVWQLITHPVLMGGASLQVTLRGVAMYVDNSAEQKAAIEEELERRVAVSMCKSIVRDIVHNVHTPERPSSPAELYITEEEQFYDINPSLHYHSQTVEAMKRLWVQVHQPKVTTSETTEDEHTPGEVPAWDLSMDHLRQVVLSLSEEDPERAGLCREEALSQYNSLILELLQPQLPIKHLTPHSIVLQLWREVCDGLVDEAERLRYTLGLPENTTWGDSQHDQKAWATQKEEVTERKAVSLNKEKKGVTSKEKEEKKGVSKPASKVKQAEESSVNKKKVVEEKKVEKLEKDMVREPSFTTINPESDTVNLQLQQTYRHTLHQQVYDLMERMVDSVWDLLEEEQQRDKQL